MNFLNFDGTYINCLYTQNMSFQQYAYVSTKSLLTKYLALLTIGSMDARGMKYIVNYARNQMILEPQVF